MAPLTEVPVEILQDVLLPFLPPKEILRLSRTSKFFASLCSSEAVWKRKLADDFNYTGAGTARTAGWKSIYRGLHRPQVYVWGESANGRLGVTTLPPTSLYTGVPFPLRLNFPSPMTRIVSLAAGGMSFYALDSDGCLHAWGTLNGESWAHSDAAFSNSGAKASTPHKLLMPNPIRSVSCGRLHISAIDSKRKIWTFVNWGRPFSIDSPVLRDEMSPPIQVECGWTFSAVLLASGDVFIWWPFNGSLSQVIQAKMVVMDSSHDKQAYANADREISCATWDANPVELARLPSLPELPTLQQTGDDVEYTNLPRLVQIAGLDSRIVGLTDQGHVLKFGDFGDAGELLNANWEYLPNFSDIKVVGQHSSFKKHPAPSCMKITHVTGSFRNFIAYSTGSTLSQMVLIGEDGSTARSVPDIKPELQNRSVISVAIGDWHSAALTADGKVLTWGRFSSGALGLGDPAKLRPGTPGAYTTRRGGPPAVTVPTEVRFDHEPTRIKDRFAFAITAAGWHTGAIVIDPDYSVFEDERNVQPSTSAGPSNLSRSMASRAVGFLTSSRSSKRFRRRRGQDDLP